jgi:hypothetical protein
MAGKARVSSSTASRTPLACRCPRARHQPMGMSAPMSSRCWIPSTSAPAHAADRANGSRCWQRIKAMTPKTFASASADAGSAPRFPNGCGRPENRGGPQEKGRPALSSRTDVCVVPAQVPPIGRPQGTSRGLLQRVSRHRDDSFLDSQVIVGEIHAIQPDEAPTRLMPYLLFQSWGQDKWSVRFGLAKAADIIACLGLPCARGGTLTQDGHVRLPRHETGGEAVYNLGSALVQSFAKRGKYSR